MSEKKWTARTRGFSLLEGIIALAILGFMIGIASSHFLSLGPKYRLQNAVWEINSRLNYARFKAIAEGRKIRIRFETTSYVLEKYDEDKMVWIREQRYFLNGVALNANNNPIFHPEGTVSNLATISISNTWGKYRITLAISGRIKITRL